MNETTIMNEDTLMCQGIEVRSPQGDICPICGRIIGEEFLPDARGFVDERLYQCGGVSLISPVILECTFWHFFDEDENMTMLEPHELIATVEADFNRNGKCIAFQILGIHPAGH